MTRQPLTDRQLAVYVFMRDYHRENDQLPSSRAIAHHIGAASNKTAFCIQVQLEAKGWIERNAAGKYRFARVREATC